MSNSDSTDKIREKNREILGDSFGDFYSELSNQLYWLQFKWQEYVELYGTNPERIELLNEAAPSFFHHLQDVLLDDILLHISRLTDRSKSFGKENLTFAALPGYIDGEMKIEIQLLVDQAIDSAAFAKDWRNRRLAHHDLKLALDGSAKPLLPLSRRTIKETLAALHEVLNRISEIYFDTELFQEVFDSGMGAEHLLYVLHDGVIADRARKKRIKTGEYLPEDLHKPPIL